jgi:Peptidyl-prolyl cis-trans isomerase (rotamase) - cyclophilin family
MKKIAILTLIAIVALLESCSAQKDPATTVRFETNYGNITIKLYPETTKHRKNFLKLVEKGFYNGVLFHRVIAGFMIQGGDPLSKNAKPKAVLGKGTVGYTVPAEFVYPQYYHKRGALAAARQSDEENPRKASSGCQFYIVQGKIFTDDELNIVENNNEMRLEQKLFKELLSTKREVVKEYQLQQNQTKLDELRDKLMDEVRDKMKNDSSYKFTQQQRTDYLTIGGAPHLDGEYTVFGEVNEGMEIVDKIAKTAVDQNNRPLEDVRVIRAFILK